MKSKPEPSNAVLVRQHPIYARHLGSLTSQERPGTESLEDEAFRALQKGKHKPSDACYKPEDWLNQRAKSIVTLMKNGTDTGRCDEGSFDRLVREYVVVEHLEKVGPRPTWEWFQEKAKIRANSQQWLESSRKDQRREIQERLNPRSHRRPMSAPLQPGYSTCEHTSCSELAGDLVDGKVQKTNFKVVHVESGNTLKVCRACVLKANSLAADPKKPRHIMKKDSLTVQLHTNEMSIFNMEEERGTDRTGGRGGNGGKGGEGRAGQPTAPRRGSESNPLASKKQKTMKEMLHNGSHDGSPGVNGNNSKHKGTEADPILLSSSDDDEEPKNRKGKLYMAVVNPCQRQTRHSSKIDVETDAVLDGLKCFMPPEGGRGSVKFALRDYFKLRPMEFLNDSCIDYFMKAIDLRLQEELPSAWKRCYFFNSFFYKKLTDNQSVVISEETKALAGKPLGELDQADLQALRCYDLTKSWTKNVDLFEKDYLFIPVCENLHWSLLIVCHPGRGAIKSNTNDPREPGTFMMHLDSMRSASTYTIGKLIKMYLQNEWKAKLRQDGDSAAKRWVADHPGEDRDFLQMTVKRPRVPLQDNHFDCGLFLCAYVDHFLAHLPKTMNEKKVPRKPLKMTKLTASMRERCHFPRVPCFLTQKWFSSDNVGNMRTDMALRAIKAMAVNAGIMDSHARWMTDKMLTQEQQHMMTYLMNQEEMLKDRNETYVGPEWLEVLTDEEGDGGGEDEDCIPSGDDMSEDIIVDINEPVNENEGWQNARSTRGWVNANANASVVPHDDPHTFRRRRKADVDEPVESTARGDRAPRAFPTLGNPQPRPLSASGLLATLKQVSNKKRERNTPNLQAVTQKHRDGTIEVIDGANPVRRAVPNPNPFYQPSPSSTTISSGQRGNKLVERSIRGSSRPDARKRSL